MPLPLSYRRSTEDGPEGGRELRDHDHRHEFDLEKSEDLEDDRREEQGKHRVAKDR